MAKPAGREYYLSWKVCFSGADWPLNLQDKFLLGHHLRGLLAARRKYNRVSEVLLVAPGAIQEHSQDFFPGGIWGIMVGFAGGELQR